MRTFVIGDVHGKPELVEDLLSKAGIIDETGKRDRSVRVIQVGDLANCVADDKRRRLVQASALHLLQALLDFGERPEPVERGAVTHAGVTPDWGWESAKEAFDAITYRWHQASEDPVFSRISYFRGGRSMLGGILWSDMREPKSQLFRQVIGHTPLDELVVQHGDDGDWTLRHVDWGGKHFHRLAGIWLDDDGDYIETVRFEEREAA